jgi:aminopeptidase
MDWLNSLGLESLHFRGPGTDLKVGLVKDHIWVGGWGTAKNGVKCSPNIPTEEVFTMPHRDRVNGTVTATKPLSVRGQVISGFSITFKDGVAVEWKADNGLETLTGLLETDEGAKRLGEVALVPASSGVSRTGLLFYNGLYDENAASHIALGRCYAENMKGCDDLSEDEKLAAGANDSFIHEDWMIGSDQVDVDGILLDGSTKPLMVKGEWVDPV